MHMEVKPPYIHVLEILWVKLPVFHSALDGQSEVYCILILSSTIILPAHLRSFGLASWKSVCQRYSLEEQPYAAHLPPGSGRGQCLVAAYQAANSSAAAGDTLCVKIFQLQLPKRN